METIEVKMVLDPEDQSTWMAIVDHSIYTIAGVARTYDINENQLRRYLKGQSKPQAKTMERVKTIMKKLVEQPRPPRHPSFGYANAGRSQTPE